MGKKVAVSDARHASYDIERDLFKNAGIEFHVLNCVTEDDVINLCSSMDGILLDMAPMTERVVRGLENVKVVNRYGVGYDNVDVHACTAKGIQVTNVPDYCAEDVSDHAIALLFSCIRQISLRDKLIRQGEWNIRGNSFRLRCKTLGVLGGGGIARQLMKKLSAFDMNMLVYDPYVDAEVISACGGNKVDLKEVLSKSDIISLHMPVTDETSGMLDEHAFSLVKPGVIIINTARGQLIKDEALLNALQDGTVGFAGLDTHNTEPLPETSPYCKLDNVVLTDHTAYNTTEGIVELKTKSAKNVIAVLNDELPTYPVNKI